MHLLAFLQEPGPVLRLGLLLPENEVDAARAVVVLGVGDINVGVEVEVNSIADALGVGTAERHLAVLEIDLERVLGDVGRVNGEEDDVLLGVGLVGALRPGHCLMLACVLPVTIES